MVGMGTELPSPYDYLDHRQFLADWFAAKKSANPRYSHRLFARRAGTSVSLLTHVIRGERNLTAPKVDAFVSALGLRAGEARFFGLLVAFDAATEAEERNGLWQEISTTKRFREARGIDRSSFDYLSKWYLPAVRELASHPRFQADPDWVAAQLEPPITRAQAADALASLKALGLLVPEGDTLRPAEQSVATPPELSQLAARNYHHGMLTKAREAIERFPREDRHLLAVTVGIPRLLLPELKNASTAMMQRLMTLCDEATEPTEQVLQINLALFPLTRPVPLDEEP